MIKSYYFAWVDSSEIFDSNKHARKDLEVLKLHISQKRGELFAKAELLLTQNTKLPVEKFLLISVKTKKGIVPLIKCKPVSMFYGQLAGVNGVLMECHAKSDQFETELNQMRQKLNFDYRFILNTTENALIDFRLMSDRLVLNINKYNYEVKKLDDSNKILAFFPTTVLNYQKNPGIKKLTATLNMQWLYKDIVSSKIGSNVFSYLASYFNENYIEANSFETNNAAPVISEQSGINAKILNEKLVTGKYIGDFQIKRLHAGLPNLINAGDEYYFNINPAECVLELECTRKISRNEKIVLKIDSGLDDSKTASMDQYINFNIVLDEFIESVSAWEKNKQYYKGDNIRKGRKRYKSLMDQKEDRWIEDNWECMHNPFIAENEISVACQEYGKKLIESALEIVEQFLLYKNQAFVTKVRLPIDSFVNLHFGEYVWLERDFSTKRAGFVVNWELKTDDRSEHCWIELADTLKQKTLPVLEIDESKKVVSDDMQCEEDFAFVPSVIKIKDFEYLDYSDQFPMISVFENKYFIGTDKDRYYLNLQTEIKKQDNEIIVKVQKVVCNE